LGTVGSICSDQAVMPPAKFQTLRRLRGLALKRVLVKNSRVYSHIQQINDTVTASLRRELFAHHLISTTQTG
jgi:hypothetical protein